MSKAEAAAQLVSLERRGHVAVVTLNRPEKLNALNDALAERLHGLLDEIEAGWPQIRVVVLTGAGRAFSAGGDMGQIAQRTDRTAGFAPVGREVVDLAPHLRRLSQPVIAAVNGLAVGAGLALACACDLRLAGQGATFASPFVRLGLTADSGLSQSLQRIIGVGLASEMILTGRTYDAAWAAEARLVNAVLPDCELLTHAIGLAETIAAHAPMAVRSNKKALDAYTPDLTGVIAAERELNRQSDGGADRREAALAFFEKRPPKFTGS